MEIRSPARKEIIAFVRKTKMGEVYEFNFPGTATEAVEFVKRMRTELSRLRALVLQSGRKLSKFKVLLVRVEQVKEKPPHTIVVLKKAENGQREVDQFLDEALIKELTGEA